MTKTQKLLSIREHLRNGIEGHRKRLAVLWENGSTDSWLYGKLKEQYDRMNNKLDEINFELCPYEKA